MEFQRHSGLIGEALYNPFQADSNTANKGEAMYDPFQADSNAANEGEALYDPFQADSNAANEGEALYNPFQADANAANEIRACCVDNSPHTGARVWKRRQQEAALAVCRSGSAIELVF